MQDLKFKLLQCVAVLNTIAQTLPAIAEANPEASSLQIIMKSCEMIDRGNKSIFNQAPQKAPVDKFEAILNRFDHTQAKQQ